jgi:predicted permease
MLDTFWSDLRLGVRSLMRSPGLSAIAILSLALGIGAATAMYSTIYAVVLDPFPYKNVDELMSIRVWQPDQPGFRTYYSTDQYLEFAERSTIFDGVVASTISDVLMTGLGDPERLRGNYVTADTFRVMGVPPLQGRAITPEDVRPEAPLVAVLGYKFWQRRFGGETGVLGRQLRLNDKIYTVVGVMPKRFMWRGADIYLPIVYQRGKITEGVRIVHVLGRLKPGVSESRAETDLRPIVEDLHRQDPTQIPEKFRVGLLPFKQTFPSGLGDTLWTLFGAVGLLLLIACANVSNLLLSKAAGRTKEMAVRAALGAGRGRLIRQLLTESLVLGAAGAALGVAFAHASLDAVLALVPRFTIPDESEITINMPVLLFTLAVSVATALLFGLAPAFSASANLVSPLKESGRGSSGSRRQSWLRSVLVVSEVALSLILLVGAGLMMRTLLNMQSADTLSQPDRILTLRTPLTDQRYPTPERRAVFMSELLERTRQLPGVRSAAINVGLHPFAGWGFPVVVPGSQVQDKRPVIFHQISPDYTKLAGVPLLAGRLLDATDVSARLHRALVNQAFVTRYLSGRDPLSSSLRIPGLRSRDFGLTDDAFEIVGVVKDVTNRFFTGETWPEVYVPFTILARPDMLIVQTSQDASSLASAVRAQVVAIDKDQPVMDVRTGSQFLTEFVLARPRFNLFLLGVFAVIGLALATIGVYGVISHGVARQTQEIGVRMALGAGVPNIIRMVLSRGVRLILVGMVIGFAGSAGLTRYLRQQLWKVSTFDMVAFVGAGLVLLAIGLVACWWPARRAARVDPITALRYE